MADIVFFKCNNWFCGRDYPDSKTFREWMRNDLNLTLRDDSFAKKNRLCIHYGILDMANGFTVSAPREWVEKNCPEIIGSQFEVVPKEGETVPSEDYYGIPFREYKEENFGVEYYEVNWYDDEDDSDDYDEDEEIPVKEDSSDNGSDESDEGEEYPDEECEPDRSWESCLPKTIGIVFVIGVVFLWWILK